MTRQDIAEANRRRYEELRAAGQDTAKPLPPATPLDGAPIAEAAIIHRTEVPAGWYETVRLKRGEALRLVDLSGQASAAVIGWCRHDPTERLNCADTAKVQWTAAMARGRVILTDMGRVFLSLVEDTSGAHDLLVGGSTAESTGGGRNTQDNFLAAAAKLGLGLRDIPPCLTFFAPVSVDAAGRFVWNGARKRAGDFVDLRAEMDLVLVVSNCAHPLAPAPGESTVALIHHRAPPSGADDACRTASPEIARAFAFTDRLT